MNPPKTASLPKPPRQATLAPPPRPEETKGNISQNGVVQLSFRLDPAKHREIKITAINQGMSIGDYLIWLHDQSVARK